MSVRVHEADSSPKVAAPSNRVATSSATAALASHKRRILDDLCPILERHIEQDRWICVVFVMFGIFFFIPLLVYLVGFSLGQFEFDFRVLSALFVATLFSVPLLGLGLRINGCHRVFPVFLYYVKSENWASAEHAITKLFCYSDVAREFKRSMRDVHKIFQESLDSSK